MKILVSNDDGISAPGLWGLVQELKKVAEVVVVAPDRERSAIGTAVTLRRRLRVNRIDAPPADVEAYSVDGTPGDCVLLALGKLFPTGVDMVVSGINQGPNIGDDVLISGTVGAALQGYLRGLPAIAVSLDSWDGGYFDNAARFAALLARRIGGSHRPKDIFLNVNVPNMSLDKISGARVTRLGHRSHIDSVAEGHDGNEAFFYLVRQRLDGETARRTDLWELEHGNISVTQLRINRLSRPSVAITDSLCAELLRELKESKEPVGGSGKTPLTVDRTP